MGKKIPKNSIVGFTIVGGIKGTRKLLFTTKKEALSVTKRAGGVPKKAVRIGGIRRPFTTKFNLNIKSKRRKK